MNRGEMEQLGNGLFRVPSDPVVDSPMQEHPKGRNGLILKTSVVKVMNSSER
jgi:hypothetical protein